MGGWKHISGRGFRVNGGGGEINYGMCENIFQSILIFGQNISVCSRQIGPRIIGPRTAGPQKVGPGAPDSWAPERCWSPTVRIESRIFNCKHILKIVLGGLHISWNCIQSNVFQSILIFVPNICVCLCVCGCVCVGWGIKIQ